MQSPVDRRRPSSPEELDRSVATLRENADAWIATPPGRKIEYARSVLEGCLRVSEAQVEAAVRAKGLAPDSPLTAEEWLAGPYAQIRLIRILIDSLAQIAERGAIRIDPRRVRSRADGRVAVEVFPLSLADRLLYGGFRAEVWMQPEVALETLSEHVGSVYRRRESEGKVALVLGAGNVASIAPCDAIHKLFFEGHVVLLKLSPVNDYLGRFMEDAFGDLIRDGFMRTAYGGADVGEHLCRHPGVDEIHITGAEATHDAIVFGPGDDGAERKARGEPILTKRITSELGNVSPIIVVPGDWSDGDLRFHAENLATQIAQNCGFNCNATKVIVTHEGWPQRTALLDHLRRVLRALPTRPAYYPGAEARYDRFLRAYPAAEILGERGPGVLPPALVGAVDPTKADALAFDTESFCSFTAETALPGRAPGDFIGHAVDFCNDRLRGTLNAGIVVDPSTRRSLRGVLDEAIAELRYGTIAVNHWPALGYVLGSTTWGAFPGHTIENVQSGIGVVHNAMLFDSPEKTVIDGPFRVRPKPPWFLTHRNAHRVAKRLVSLEARPSLFRLPAIVAHALRG